MELVVLRDKQQFDEYYAGKCRKRLAFERSIAEENLGNDCWEMPGFCDVCGKATRFRMDWFNLYEHPVYGKTPCYRERMICSICEMNNRLRFVASYLINLVNNSKDINDIYLYEQISPFFRHISNFLSNKNVFGSEYLGNNIKSGEIINGIRHEDALALSLASNSIDVIVSNDVYEHVPDIARTFSEASRVLRDNGRLILAIPFQTSEISSRKRAEADGEKINYLEPARYHGNPLSEQGALVFYDFGWDIIQLCKDAGFAEAYMLAYYSLLYGHIGGGVQYIFVAEKQGFSLIKKIRGIFR